MTFSILIVSTPLSAQTYEMLKIQTAGAEVIVGRLSIWHHARGEGPGPGAPRASPEKGPPAGALPGALAETVTRLRTYQACSPSS
jgi:hypothetical protein